MRKCCHWLRKKLFRQSSVTVVTGKDIFKAFPAICITCTLRNLNIACPHDPKEDPGKSVTAVTGKSRPNKTLSLAAIPFYFMFQETRHPELNLS
jgi:hypothetical protein